MKEGGREGGRKRGKDKGGGGKEKKEGMDGVWESGWVGGKE